MDLHFLSLLSADLLRGAAQLTAGALVAGLWQGLVLCASTGLVLHLVPRSTATLRFATWATVFCVSVALPFADLPQTGLAGYSVVAKGSPLTLNPRWSYLLAAIWVLTALYRLGDLLLQGFGLRAFWKGAVPVAPEALAGLDGGLELGRKRVELCTSNEVDRPSVIGFFAPRILIPEWLFAQLSPVELNHIVLHEIEHLRRGDDWVNLLQKVGLVLLPLNPALFWIDRRLSKERELACDDGVLRRTNMPRSYAASLASIAEKRLDSRLYRHVGALALAATGLKRQGSELGQRIESILGRRAPVSATQAGAVALLLVAGVVGSAAALAHAPQLVSFRSEAAMPQFATSPPESSGAPLAANPVRRAAGTMPTAQFQDVSFHSPSVPPPNVPPPNVPPPSVPPPSFPPPSVTPVRRANAVVRRSSQTGAASQRLEFPKATPVRQRFVVLTSWEDAPVSRVVVQTPDGRFFLAPYAAVPTQAGWLIVQL